MALIKRTVNEVLKDAMIRLRDNTPITNMNAGSIGRALAEAMSPEIPKLYDYGEEILYGGWITKANDEYLDLIGALFSYPRRDITTVDPKTGATKTEKIDKETYRFEISNRVLTAANANYQSVRLRCLAVPGVADVIGKEYTYGTGSFSIVVVPAFGFTISSIRAGLEAALQDAKSYGIKPGILFPVQIKLDCRLQLVFHESASDSERSSIRSNVKTKLYQYFGSFKRGQGFVFYDFIQEIKNVSEKIADLTIQSFMLNGQPSLLTNHNILEDEMIIPAYIEIF